jgi:hypothetical protein
LFTGVFSPGPTGDFISELSSPECWDLDFASLKPRS